MLDVRIGSRSALFAPRPACAMPPQREAQAIVHEPHRATAPTRVRTARFSRPAREGISYPFSPNGPLLGEPRRMSPLSSSVSPPVPVICGPFARGAS